MAEKETWEDTSKLLDEMNKEVEFDTVSKKRRTHPGNSTIHRGKAKTTNYAKGGMVTKGTAKLPSKRAMLDLGMSPMRTTDYAKVSPMNSTDRNSAMGKALRKEK